MSEESEAMCVGERPKRLKPINNRAGGTGRKHHAKLGIDTFPFFFLFRLSRPAGKIEKKHTKPRGSLHFGRDFVENINERSVTC